MEAAASSWWYLVLIAAIVGERWFELVLTRRNARWASARGAVVSGRGHYPWMVALHVGFLVAAPMEVFVAGRVFRWDLAAPMLLLLGAAMALRYWAIHTLGPRWTTRVVVVPGLAPVNTGPYRFVRHPNYVAVVTEGIALPLVHGAWITALVFSVLNAIVLAVRVRSEEGALRLHGDYDEALAGRRRFVPGIPPAGRSSNPS